MNRFKIAMGIASVSTVMTVLGGIFAFRGVVGMDSLMFVGILLGLVSYLFAGLGTAIKMAGGIAKWGWIILPFPYDLCTFLIAFYFAIVAFFFLPIIPVSKVYRERGV